MRKVSVIIPTYNRGHLIGEAIESVLGQDIADCEIEAIVVDDGSTDDTSQVIKLFRNKVKYIYQENQGAGVARNRGIEETTGEWIAFLDSDDRWLPDKLSLQFKVWGAFPEYKAIHSNFYTFADDRIVIPKGLEYWVTTIAGCSEVDWGEFYGRRFKSSDYGITRAGLPFEIYAGNLFCALLNAPCAACWTLLMHRDCLNENIRFAENYPTWEDYWFFCRFSEHHNLLFLDCPTAENRGHAGPRLTQAPRVQTLECYLDICEKIYFPSTSINRPSNKDVLAYYHNAQIDLFKEYLKQGKRREAQEVLKALRNAKYRPADKAFWIYLILSKVPFEVVSHLLKIKRTLTA